MSGPRAVARTSRYHCTLAVLLLCFGVLAAATRIGPIAVAGAMQTPANQVADAALTQVRQTLLESWPAAEGDSVAFDAAAVRAAFDPRVVPDPDPGLEPFASAQVYDNLAPLDPGVTWDSNHDRRLVVEYRGASGTYVCSMRATVQRTFAAPTLPLGVVLYTGGFLRNLYYASSPVVCVEAPLPGVATAYVAGPVYDKGGLFAANVDVIVGAVPPLQFIASPDWVAAMRSLAVAHGRYFTSVTLAQASLPVPGWAPQGGISGLCVVEPPVSTSLSANLNGPLNTPQAPGCLLLLGGSSLTLGGTLAYCGTVYCEGGTNLNGSAGIHGMLASQGPVYIRGTNVLAYNEACVSNAVWPTSVDATGSVEVGFDTTAPATTATPSATGWTSSPVSVSLSADDEIGGSGVAATYWQIDGGPRQTYALDHQPVLTSSVQTLTYWSTDNAGNKEADQTLQARIDTFAPVTTATPSTTGYTNDPVIVSLSAQDESGGSGIDATFWQIDDGQVNTYGVADQPVLKSGQTVTYWSTDRAGNAEVPLASHATTHASMIADAALTQVRETLLDSWPDSGGDSVPFHAAVVRAAFPQSTFPDPAPGLGQFASAQVYDNLSPLNPSVRWDSNADGKLIVESRGASGVYVCSMSVTVQRHYAASTLPRGIVVYAGGNLLSSGAGTNPKIRVEVSGSQGVVMAYVGGSVGVPEVFDLSAIALVTGPAVPQLESVVPAAWVADMRSIAQAHGRYFTSAAAAQASPASHDWAPQGGLSGLCVIEPPPGTSLQLPSYSLNTEQRPGCLLLLGGSQFTPGSYGDYYGAIYCEGATGPTHGNPRLHGMLVAGGDVDMRGVWDVLYNDNVVASVAWPTSVDAIPSTQVWLDMPDVTPPTTTALPRTTGWTNSPVLVLYTASDESGGSGVAATYARIDGGPVMSWAEYYPQLSNSSQELTYWSVDKAGNIEPAQTLSVNIDRSAPATSHGYDGSWRKGDVTVTLTATDEGGSAVDRTFYTIDGGQVQTYALDNKPLLTNSAQTLTYWSTDNAGNTEGDQTLRVQIDRIAPVTTSTGLQASNTAGWRAGSQEVTLAATDFGGSGGIVTTYQINGGPLTTYTRPFSISGIGSSTVTFYSTDAAGNVEAAQIGYVNIAPPVVTTGTWSAQALPGFPPATFGLGDVDAVDADHAWAVGTEGFVLRTTNGGLAWSKSSLPDVVPLSGVSFVDANEGWAVGWWPTGGPYVVHTEDGGVTWTLRDLTVLGTAANLRSVDFVDREHGWVVGDGGAIASTDNGGASWTAQASGTSETLLHVTCVDSNVVWAVGSHGTILKTTNGGATWMAQASTVPSHLWSLAAADAQCAWAVGLHGTVIHTVDGGQTWSPQVTGTAYNLIDVAFRDARHGCIAGNYGLVLRTVDGGAHWTAEPTGTSEMLWGIAQPTAKIAWAVGNGPTVLAYDPGDALAPTTTATPSATGWTNADVSVSLSATDAGSSGLDQTYWRIDGGQVQTYALDNKPLLTNSAQTLTYWSTDNAGNTEGDQTLRVQIDRSAPSILAPDVTAEATGPLTQVTLGATASDLVDGVVPVTYTLKSGAPLGPAGFPLGDTVVTAYAIDAQGNAATEDFTVTVIDSTPPAIGDVPEAITLEAADAAGAAASWDAPTAFDIVDGAIVPTCSPASGSTFPLGTTTVTVTATDAAGNTASASFKVSVIDTTPPTIHVPNDITVEATGPNGAPAAFSASAVDRVDGSVAVAFSKDPGTTFSLGTTTVTVSATDAAGNAATASFKVTVVDSTPPVISHVPADITVEATSSAGGVATWDAQVAFDAVDGTVAAPCQPTSGSTFPLGATTVTVTATDKAVNTASAGFKVTVVDSTPPVISAPTTMTVEASGPSGAVVTFASQVAALDAVDGNVTWAASPASGSTFPLGTTTVKVTATDKAGNSASKSVTVSVVDTTGPVISAKDHYDVAASGPTGASISAAMLAISASDKVNGTVPVTYSPALPFTFPLGTSTLTVSAKDSRGNTTVLTTKVNVTYTWGAWVEPSATSYKVGSTVKVAFKLGSGITTARAYLTVTDPSGAKKVDKQPFAYNKGTGEYRFNTGKSYGLVTSGWVKGVYTLSVDLGDGVSHTRSFTLK